MATTLSADSQAIALLCSTLALPPRGDQKPLSQREWNQTAALIRQSPPARPGALLGRAAEELARELDVSDDLARRISSLLARGGQLAFELERLAARGIWLLTRADEEYPQLWKKRLREKAPPVIFGAGPKALLNRRAVAIVGSRDVDAEGLDVAEALGRQCARDDRSVASGAARGVDMAAMRGAVEAGGNAVGVLADSLEKTAQRRELRDPLIDGALTLVTPYHPGARFNVGHAMRRNSLIYCLAEAAIVVASTPGKGGTTAGAVENLRASWVPLFVFEDGGAGNSDLIRQGGTPLPANALDSGQSISQALLTPGEAIREMPPDREPSLPEPAIGAMDETASPPQPLARLRDEFDEPGAVPATLVDEAGPGIFAVVWPLLAAYLVNERSEKDIAERFELELSQARAWLKRAVREGKATRVESRRRYTVARGQSSLFAQD